MKIIDSHIHFWNIDKKLNEWVNTADLPSIVSPNDFSSDGFIHVEAHSEKHDSLCEYKWLKKYFPNKNIKIVAFIDFTQHISLFEQKAIQFGEITDIVGVRQIMATSNKSQYSPYNKDIALDFSSKLEILAKNNLVFDCQMYPDQLIKYIDIIIKSNVIMALEHFGLPILADNKNMSLWNVVLKEIEQSQNTFIKLSGLELNNDNNKIAQCLDIVLRTVNSGKLCYGSNYPISNKNHPLLWQAILIKNINNDQQILEDVFANTANHLYSLNIW